MMYPEFPLSIEPRVSATVVTENTMAAFHIQRRDRQLMSASVMPSISNQLIIAGAAPAPFVAMKDDLHTSLAAPLVEYRMSTAIDVPALGILTANLTCGYDNPFAGPQANLFVSYWSHSR